MLAYVAYLPLVVILAYLLFRQKGRRQSDLYFLPWLGLFSCFVFFIIFPAYSPRFYFKDLEQLQVIFSGG